MSFLYKIFGIPGTFDEFAEKVREKGCSTVDVLIPEFESFRRGGCYELRAGGVRLKVPVGPDEYRDEGNYKCLVYDSLSAVKRLEAAGFEVPERTKKHLKLEKAKVSRSINQLLEDILSDYLASHRRTITS